MYYFQFFSILLYMKTYQEKYLKYKQKYLLLKNKLNSSISQTGGGNNGQYDKTLTLIKAEWCGHCKAFKSTWEELPSQIKNINFKTLDSDTNKEEIEKYDITGYPSLVLENGDKKIKYEGKRDVESIKKFVAEN